MQNQLFYGSICITDVLELLKQKHSAFIKGQNGKIYANVNVWLNSELDKFGNIMCIQLNPSKEMKDLDKKHYIGNLKKSDRVISDKDIQHVDTDFDVPVAPPKGAVNANNPADSTDDLPF